MGQQGEFKVSVAGTATGSIPHEIPLKMTQIPGGQLSETTGFIINPENVLQVKQGENLIVTTSENLKVNNVKVRNVQGLPVDLLPMPNNLWSLQNLVPGVYSLDVIADMSSSGILGVYETVLVILQPDQQPLPPTTVINELSIIIENGPPLPPLNDTTPSPEPSPCPPETQENGVCPPTDDITPVPEPSPCPPDAPDSEVCPPTDDITPVPEPSPCPPDAPDSEVCPPTDDITPEPGPPPPEDPEPEPPTDVPDEGDSGNGDSGNGDDSQPNPEPEPDPPQDNEGSDTDTDTE